MGGDEHCEDHVGNLYADNSLYIRKRTKYRHVLDGESYSTSSGNLLKKFTAFPVGLDTTYPNPEAPWSAPVLVNIAHEIYNRTSPNEPSVNLPVSLVELRDIPRIVQVYGRNLLKQVASGYLSWQFALKPMLSDLRNLLKFQESVERRLKEFGAIGEGKELKRRCSLGRQRSETPSAELTLNSVGAIIKAVPTVSDSLIEWGTSRWKCFNPLRIPRGDALRRRIRRMTSGFTAFNIVQASWELLPWSWLVDWFLPVGNYISTFNNTIPIHCSSLCYMRTAHSRRSYRITASPSWVSLSGDHFEEEEQKSRTNVRGLLLVPPLPTVPVLTGRQLSILGAIVALRAR
jgi:hypothetical protein